MMELILHIGATLIVAGVALFALDRVHSWLKRKLESMSDSEMTVCNHCGWTVPESFMVARTGAAGSLGHRYEYQEVLFSSPACLTCVRGKEYPPEAIPPEETDHVQDLQP